MKNFSPLTLLLLFALISTLIYLGIWIYENVKQIEHENGIAFLYTALILLIITILFIMGSNY